MDLNRRRFLERLGIITASGILLPSMYWSCRDEEEEEDDDAPVSEPYPIDPNKPAFNGKIAIIGAGAAGLAAAHRLVSKNISVTVFEATGVVGGRVRPKTDWADFPIELGAEEVHGHLTSLGKMIEPNGGQYATADTTDLFWLENTFKSDDQLANDADFQRLEALVEQLEEGEYSGSEVSIAQFLANNQLASRMNPLAQARMGNEYGTSISRMGVLSLADAQKDMPNNLGEDRLLRNTSIFNILTKAYANVLPLVQLNKPVSAINYVGTGVELRFQDGTTQNFDKVIVTVPLTQLKANSIAFNPALPEETSSAIQRLGMDAGMKIILRFNSRFWAEDMGSFITDGAVPEYWATGQGRSESAILLTAFVMAEKAETLSAAGDQAPTRLLQDLDRYFGNSAASRAFDQAFIMDWTKEPYIGGAYSYPAIGSMGAYASMAKPIADKVFLAGEATNTQGNFATVHGAIDSGLRAVRQAANV
jgi:monoamine oxidase